MSFTEDEFSKNIDNCLYNSYVKIGGGVLTGTIASLLFFKRKRWPITTGLGFGIGYAYADCERDLNKLLTVPKSS